MATSYCFGFHTIFKLVYLEWWSTVKIKYKIYQKNAASRIPEDAWRTSFINISHRVRLLAASACSRLTRVSWTLEHSCRSVSRSSRPNRAPSRPVSVMPRRRRAAAVMLLAAGVAEDVGRSEPVAEASDRAWSETSAASRCTSWRRHAITARRRMRCGLNSISWQQTTSLSVQINCNAELTISSLVIAMITASIHCTYPQKDGQAELAWVAG